MKKIRITESQLEKLSEQLEYPVFAEHWEKKFMKAIEVLLKLGHRPEELIKKIESIASNSKIGTTYPGDMEVSHNMKYNKE